MKQGSTFRRPEDCDPETNRNADSNEWVEEPEVIMPPVSTNVGRCRWSSYISHRLVVRSAAALFAAQRLRRVDSELATIGIVDDPL
jgi:hypothetical protein